MNKIRNILLLLWLCSFNFLKAQDMHYSQFYSSTIYLNPAFAGANVCSRVSAIYRNQWPGIKKGYSSSLVSWDHYIRMYNLGLGLMLARDVSGTGDLTRTLIYPTFAYEARITRKFGMRFGIQPGLGISSINFNKLTFGDQIARGGNVPTIENTPSSAYYFDVGAGMLGYGNNYWFGLSFNHLNSPIESLYANSFIALPIKTSLHGGYKFNLEEDVKSISVAFNYRGQNKFDQLDIGTYYAEGVFNVGLWYRGIPFLKSYKPGYSNNDALSVIIGIKTDRMSIGYSYDFTISRLSNSSSNGAHELSLSYQFCNLKNQRKRRIIVNCPSF